jgi:hypothetical protein
VHIWLRCQRVALFPIPNYGRWGFYFQAAIVFTCLVWFQLWPPIPTVAIGFLGVVAAIMTVRADRFTHAERVVWILISFALFIVEMSAIYKDRNEHDRQLTEQRMREDEARRAETKSFQDLIKNGQQLFEHESALSQETVARLTGGDTYAVVHPNLIPVVEPNTFTLTVAIGKNCKRRSIPDAHINLQEAPFDTTRQGLIDMLTGKKGGVIFTGSIDPDWSQILSQRITPALTGVTTYYINIFAKNKPSYETLQVRKNEKTGDWEFSFKVIRQVTPSTPTKKGKYVTLEETKPTWLRTVFMKEPK